MTKQYTKDIWVGSGGFAGIPRKIMKSADYRSLSGNAVKLLLELSSQFKGHKAANNGDLTCAWSLLSNRGFNSKGTLQRSKKELLQRNLITEVRKGIAAKDGRRVCSLFALTWQPLDEQFYPDGTPKHNKPSTNIPLRNDWCENITTGGK